MRKSLRRFFDNNVGIRASNAERTEARSSGTFAFPIRQFCADEKRTVLEIDFRVWIFKVQAWR